MTKKHETLFRRLKGKSQEELVALLEHLVQRQPEVEAVLELLVELPLSGTPMPEKQSRKHTIDPAAIRCQADVAFDRAGDDWDAAGRAAVELEHIYTIGQDFAQAGVWGNAQIVYATLAEEILSQYDRYQDEGQLSWVLSECADGLLTCLKVQTDLPQNERLDAPARETLLTSLFALWYFGDRYGGIRSEISSTMVALATASERTLLEAWLREKLQPGQDTASQWRNRGLVDFLALLKQAEGSDQEEVLAEYRHAHLYTELAEHYLQLGRQSEALTVAQEHLTETFEVTRFAERLLASDAQWRDQSLAFVEGRLAEEITAAKKMPKDLMRPHGIDTYRCWLSEQYRLAGRMQQALDIEMARLQAHPDEATYFAVRSAAQADKQNIHLWPGLRSQLLQALKQQRRWAALVAIFVDEGEVEQALAALQEDEQMQKAPTYPAYGYRSFSLATLRVRVARVAEEMYPEEAIQIYARVVEALIEQRGRENYQQAVEYVSQMKKLYQKVEREKTWEAYIVGLRTRYKSLRAFKEELARKGL
jgi:hypothetical protein